MKALAIDARPEVGHLATALRMTDLPVPEPKSDQVRVRIEATAINVDDDHMAAGSMFGGFAVAPKPTPDTPWVPGSEFAGTIDAVGSKVRHLRAGQRVLGLRGPKTPGPWAEYGIAKASAVAPLPPSWTPEEAAGLCLGGAVICSIIAALGPPEGKLCLVVGASGGIGTLLVPVLVHAGARVWGVCSGKNRQRVEGRGAQQVLDYEQAPFDEQLRAANTRADAVIDLVGGRDVQQRGLACTHRGGSFITIVGPEKYVGERKLGPWALTKMVGRIAGSWIGSQLVGPKYRLVGPLAPDFDAIDRWIVAPGIRPLVDRVVPFELSALNEALRYVRSLRARGKVVISMTRED